MMNKKIIIFWSVIVFSIILVHEIITMNSAKILLNTKPIDPRDLIRGNYINLKFDISEIKDEKNEIKNHKYIYIILDKNSEDIATFKDYSFEKPKDELFLKAKVNYCYQNKCYLEYNFEDYFTDTKSAKDLEKKKNLKALVAINKGYSRLLKIIP